MKKIWLNLVIFVGCFLLLVTTLGTILIMAPGMELLGVMFIRSTSGAIKKSYSVTDSTLYREVVVQADNIPITIEFVQSYVLTADMVEEFNGFAKAGDAPTLDVSTTSSTIQVKSHEYEAFLAYSRSEESGLIVKVPTYYTNKITIKSDKSPVTFCGLSADLTDVSIETKGSIQLNTDMVVQNLTLNMGNKDAVIGEDVDIAGFISINTKRGDVSVPKGFTGNIYFKSDSGDIRIANCGDLKVESKTGDVEGVEDEKPIVYGNVNIETGGSVELGQVYGDASISTHHGNVTIGDEKSVHSNKYEIITKSGDVKLNGTFENEANKIVTSSGDITLGNINSFDIQTKYGNIEIDESKDSVISTKSGDVFIKKTSGKHIISTNNGDVTLGDGTKEGVTNSAVVTTIGGNVKITNAIGTEFAIKTTSGDVYFTQNSSKIVKLNIESKRGDILGTGLSGEAKIKTKGKINLEIDEMNGKVDVEGKNRNVNVVVHDTCYYDIISKKNIEQAPELTTKTKTYNTVPAKGNHDTNTLKITTNKGKIIVTKI